MADADVQGLLIRIEATTAQLRQEIARGEAAVAQSAGKMDTSLGRIDSAFDRAGASAQTAGGLIKGALAAAIGAASIGTIIKTADSYSQMSDRIGLATKSFGEYNTVQERLLATANRTYRPLEEAQELYIRTSDSLRSMGLSANQSMDVMDSFSYLLVTNSASADKASSAIDAYSKSLQTGKIDADSWQAILAAMPTIVETVSQATGKSAEEIRNLGAQGKLSLDTLTEGLQKSAEANGLLADSMGVAVRDALVALNNAFSAYIGQLNESTNFTGILSSGISVLAENFSTIAEVAGVAAAGALAIYARGLAVSAAGSVLATKAAIEEAMARRAQATSVLLAAQADQRKAQTAVFLAEKEAVAAKGTAVQTQMSLQLAEARMVEARATAAVGAAQTAIVGAGRTVLGLLGGPAGIAMLAVGAATAFLTLRDNTGDLEKKLGDLSDPIDKITKKFNELDRATQSVTLRELKSTIADAEEDLSTAAGSIAFEFQSSLTNAGLAGASGFMAGIAPLPAEFQAAIDLVKKASADQASGMVVDWKAVADQVRQVPGVTAEVADALEKSGGAAATSNTELTKLKDTVSQLTGETDELTRAERENAAAKAAAAGVGQKYLEQLQKQLGAAQDKTALQAANRFISENTLLTEDMIVAIRSAAAAKDAQKAADTAATKATKDGTSAAKEAVTEAKNQAKALTDLKAQADIAIKSATGLAAAYLAGTDKSREFTLQQKVEEALLKTGAGVRKDVEKAINDQQDAQDRLNVSKSAYDLGKETADIIAQAQATLMGADALAAYNVQKAMTVALANKNIEVGSEEYKQLLAATEAQQDALKIAQRAANAGGIMDRLYPEAKLLKDYTEDQKALNAAMALYPGNAANYQAALLKLGNEYEVNRSKATLWGQMTEGAIDRIDEAFASAWGNIGSGAESLWDNLKKGFKQTLGEIAHMLTTKPLLASISNWLTGTNNGQGLGSVWSKLLGGGGGSGGGGGLSSMFGGGSDSNGWGGMVSLGKNLYSAWSNLTGVGSSIASGYASGGVSGALSGGVGYYGNMLSSLGSTLSSGFSSIVSSITGTAAASTAATTGATSALGGALSGAVAEGAASIGTNIGIAGATTAAASNGIGAAISSAMSSAAAMWPLAIVMGMYQSGKLYSAGVRPDASAMWDSAGGTALGKAAMLPQTVGAKYFEVTDNILGKVVGGKMAAILSGSTLFQAVWSKVGSKLFGSGYKTKDVGIELGVDGGLFDAQQYTKQKKKGGLLSGSSKTRYLHSALDAETQDALGSAYNEKILNSMGLFSALGVKLSDSVLDGLNIATTRISTQGKTPEAIQEELDKWFSGLGDSAVSAINAATNSGLENYNFETLTTFVNDLYSVNDSFDMLGLKLYDVSVSTGFMAEQLISMAGGLEALKAGESSFFENFYTDTEKADYALSTVNKQFEAMGVKLPGTRDAYRDMVEALDRTTESGRQMYVTLTSLSGNAAQAYSILEQRADAAAAAVQAMSEQLIGVAGNAQSALQRAISAQQKATTEAYNARVTSLNDMVSTATENVSGLTSVGNDLGAALKALRGDSDDAVKMLRAQAQATLQSALATARSGKSLSGFTGLEDALDTVSNNNTDLYGSMEDFARDQGRTANVVAELNAINGKQLTSAERSAKALQEQIDQAKKAYEAQQTQFDAELAFAQSQLDALNGVDTSVKTVAQAVAAMNASVVAALAGISGKATDASPLTNGALVESVYNDVLGRASDAPGKAYWVSQLASGAITYDQLAQAIANAAKGANQSVKAGYATGGYISGPGTGTSDSILSRLSNGEYVLKAAAVRAFGTDALDQMNALQIPAFAAGGPVLDIAYPSQVSVARSMGSTSNGNHGAQATEVRELMTWVKQVVGAIKVNSDKVQKKLDLWDKDGLPKTTTASASV